MRRKCTRLPHAPLHFLPGFARQRQSGDRKREPATHTFPSASLRLCVSPSSPHLTTCRAADDPGSEPASPEPDPRCGTRRGEGFARGDAEKRRRTDFCTRSREDAKSKEMAIGASRRTVLRAEGAIYLLPSRLRVSISSLLFSAPPRLRVNPFFPSFRLTADWAAARSVRLPR